MSYTVLVTGGAGFIGSAVVRHIIQNTQDSVINLDKLTYAGNLESLTDVADNPRYAFEQVDICDRAELDRVFAQHQPDAVMHLAAESHVDRSIDSAGEFIQTNIVGTFNLLEAARAYWQQMSSEKAALPLRMEDDPHDQRYGKPRELRPNAIETIADIHSCPKRPKDADQDDVEFVQVDRRMGLAVVQNDEVQHGSGGKRQDCGNNP